VKTESLVCLSLLLTTTLLLGQEGKKAPPQTFTGYPPSVYMQEFHACSADAPCDRAEEFRVNNVPNGCCILSVTNGNGLGKNEVRSYEVFLNGERVIPTDGSRNAQAAIKVAQRNTLKVILIGEPSSKVFILVAYDPRKSK
jgi:hypothetical protein